MTLKQPDRHWQGRQYQNGGGPDPEIAPRYDRQERDHQQGQGRLADRMAEGGDGHRAAALALEIARHGGQ